MNIFKEKALTILFGVSALFLVISFGTILFKIGGLSTPLIIHFDAFQGVDFFGEKADFWAIWIVGLVIMVINYFLANVFFHRERVLTYIIASVNTLIGIFLFVAVATIISVN